MTGHDDSAQVRAPVAGLEHLPKRFQQFIAQLEASPTAQWLPAYVAGALDTAYERADGAFPAANCKTFAETAPMASIDPSDDLASSTLRSALGQPANAESREYFGYAALLVLMSHAGADPRERVHRVRRILWHECNSQLPLLTLAAETLGPELLGQLAAGLVDLLNDAQATDRPLTRGEQYAALAFIHASGDPGASGLERRARAAIEPPLPARLDSRRERGPGDATFSVSGTLAAVPHGPIATAVRALSGWLLLRKVVDFAGRWCLGYRARAEVRITLEGLEIHEQRSLLGRQLRERTSVVAMHEVRRLSREVRYERAGTYAGLAALGLGSFVGMRLFVDGLRVPGLSGQLLWLGLLAVVGGLGLDFALVNWLDSKRGRCRFVVVTEHGKGLCLTDVEPAKLDAMLSELSRQLVRTA